MSTPERRQIPRTTLERLAYIHIEPNNGGIVLNVSPDGLCFHSIAAVEKNGPLRFSLLEQNRRIAARGELAWTDAVQKVGAVRFGSLTPEAREQIQNWISEPAFPSYDDQRSTLGAALLKAFPAFRIQRFPASVNFPGFFGLVRFWVKVQSRVKLGGFAKGLATGLLISGLAAALFSASAHRREIGQSLIHLGERLSGAGLSGEGLSGEQPPEPRPAAKTATVTSAAKQLAVNAPPAQGERKEPKFHTGVAEVSEAPRFGPSKSQPSPPPRMIGSKPQPATQQPQPSAPLISRAANSSATLARATSAASPPLPPTAVLGSPSSPGTNLVADKLATPPPAAPSGASQGGSVSAAIAPSLPQMYFELGKFKDEVRARDLSDKVTQLGLRPSVVQKGHLWMNAFYVLVGPYGDPEAAARTHQNLLSHGYKPRPFERGSRSFTFVSGLTLPGATLPVGDFTISWESYVTDAKVKFTQGNYVLGTAEGQWVKRPSRYQRDEYVYSRTGNGARLLREIHFAGLDRALVFGSSS